jgi:hypothetical protein
MSIASRQVTKEVNRIIEERMKDGYIPTIEYIISKLSEFYRDVKVGFPSFRMRKQPYRKLWNVESYNRNLSEIWNDLNNLYEEMIEQFTVVLVDFDYYDTERRKLLHQIKVLEGQLTDLLLVAEDTEGYLYSVHDDFLNRDNINLLYSTCEINTDAGICTLRESRQGIMKLDMSHYFNVVNFPILAEKEYAQNIISNKLFPESKFGYTFSDIHTSWIQEIITSKGGELVISFIVDLTPDDEIGEYISRIEMLGQSPKSMWVEPLWSLDNINFRRIPIGDGKEEKIVRDDRTTIWNFSEMRVRYLKFMIRRNIEDDIMSREDKPVYRYVIGAKNISIYKMAYDSGSILYSKAYTVTDPTGEVLTIDKASLVVDQDIQMGTSIDYYLSLGLEDEEDPTQFSWVAISPVNDPNPKEAQVADFRHVAFFTNVPDIVWDAASYDTPLETYNGISFYKVYEFPYEPVKESVGLYRGKNNWQVSPQYSLERKAIYNEAHAFGSGQTITLTYPDFTPVTGSGLIRGSTRVKSDPGENPSTIYINSSDYNVNYSTKVISKQTGSTISEDPGAPGNTVYVDYQYDKEVAKPTIYTTYIYISNVNGIDINIRPFIAAEIEAGQFLWIETTEGTKDLSSSTFFHIPPGWHKVMTTAEPRSASDRFYSVNSNRYLYELVYVMYAYANKLSETSWFNLKHNTLKSDHSRYSVIDYDGDGNKEIVVNYRPQTGGWSSSSDDLLCPAGAETYVLSYKYISTLTDKIYLKAVFSRDDKSVTALSTPTLRSYTIKLGY